MRNANYAPLRSDDDFPSFFPVASVGVKFQLVNMIPVSPVLVIAGASPLRQMELAGVSSRWLAEASQANRGPAGGIEPTLSALALAFSL